MKPRCPGRNERTFLCRLDADHEGPCMSYHPPDVDEWRQRNVAIAEFERWLRETEARIAVLESTLDGFRHAAQLAINRRANPGGQQAGTPAWACVPYSTCLQVIRDVDNAIGRDLDTEVVAGVQATRGDAT